jgi:hypothetical protein
MFGGHMRCAPAVLFLAFLSFISFQACSGSKAKHVHFGKDVRNLLDQPVEHVTPDANKLWEGEIRGQQVTYYISKGKGSIDSIVVVTNDKLPVSYRSVEYKDKYGDSVLDNVSIKMYQEDVGWNNVSIADGQSDPLKDANERYNEILREIRAHQAGYIDY